MASLLSSADIPVDLYTLTLIWPLLLRPEGDAVEWSSARERAERAWTVLEQAPQDWQPVLDPLHHLRQGKPADGAAQRHEYAEFVYFFPFVQRFLFGRGADAPMRLYRRRGLEAVRVCLPDGVSVELAVPRCNLYVFDSATAVLVCEFSSGDGHKPACMDGRRMTLADALTLNESLRHAYPPYYINDTTPAFLPRSVIWQGASPPQQARANTFAALGQSIVAPPDEGDRRPPMASWWSALLPRLEGIRLEQVLDDRMPAVAFLAVPEPQRISDGDWVRLANFDAAGEDALPYGAAFLEPFARRSCYDRFWDPAAGKTSRYLFSGFGAVTVAGSGDGFAPILREHCRRHYFQMALITQFQMATLLDASDRLEKALRQDLKDGHSRERTRRVLEDLLRFTSAYWFPEVSNQIQAREIFDLWRGHTEVQALYDQVIAEAREANAFLNQEEDQRTARSGESLNRLAAWGLPLTIATGVLGSNLVIEHIRTGDGDVLAGREWSAVALIVGVMLIGTSGLMYWLRKPRKDGDQGMIAFMGGLGVVLALLFGLGYWLLSWAGCWGR